MSHTPTKFVTVPLLVEAVQWNGKNFTEIDTFSTLRLMRTGVTGNEITDQTRLHRIKIGGWVVRHSGQIRLLTDEAFQAQYTPFKEELKDYPTSIINP